MNLTDLLINFKFVSEREPGPWIECTFTSAVMAVRSWGFRVPAKLIEAKGLHKASGKDPAKGGSIADVIKGFYVRYNTRKGQQLSNADFPALWTDLSVGRSGVFQGSMGAFPAGHHLRRHDPGFKGFHAIFVIRLDERDRVWWVDPLAPLGDYQGEFVPLKNFRKFVEGLPAGSALIGNAVVQPADPIVERPPVVTPPPKTYTQEELTKASTDGWEAGLKDGVEAEQKRMRALLGL